MIRAYAVTALRADASNESSAKNLTLIDFLAVVATAHPAKNLDLLAARVISFADRYIKG